MPFPTAETGVSYNTSARDHLGPPVGKLTGRLQRAQANLFETLPIFASAVLIAHVAGREGAQTLWGASLYLGARVVYVPLYALGIPVVRTLTWSVSLVGLLMVRALRDPPPSVKPGRVALPTRARRFDVWCAEWQFMAGITARSSRRYRAEPLRCFRARTHAYTHWNMTNATQPVAAVPGVETHSSIEEAERTRISRARAAQAQFDIQTDLAAGAPARADQPTAQVPTQSSLARAQLAGQEADIQRSERVDTGALVESARIASNEADRVEAERAQAELTLSDADAKRVESERLKASALHERARLAAQAYQAENQRDEADAKAETLRAEHADATRVQTQAALADQAQQDEFDATHLDRVDISDPAHVSPDGDPNIPPSP